MIVLNANLIYSSIYQLVTNFDRGRKIKLKCQFYTKSFVNFSITFYVTLGLTHFVERVRCRIAIFFACLMSILPMNRVSLSSS